MDTRFLLTLLAVAEGGSVAAAARRLNLSPAGVLQRLRALEAEVGATLVRRSGRNLRPTAAGAAVAARAPALLLAAERLVDAARDGALRGALRLGAVSTAITGLLPDLLQRAGERHPGIEVSLLPGGSGELYARVLDGALDAAILARPPFALPKSLGWRTLREEPLVVLAPASMAGRAPLELLRREPFVRYDRASWGGRLAEDYLRAQGVRPRERFELVTLDAIAVLVDRGLGVSLVPDWSPPWPAGLSLARLPLPAGAPVRCMGVAWSLGSAREPLVRAFTAS